jgi:hypothetical protein
MRHLENSVVQQARHRTRMGISAENRRISAPEKSSRSVLKTRFYEVRFRRTPLAIPKSSENCHMPGLGFVSLTVTKQSRLLLEPIPYVLGGPAMLNPQPLDRDYLIDSLDEVDAVIDELSFNVQDQHWLVYCALGGHEHYDLPDIDNRTGMSLPELYDQAA